jgi:hypothetical protein
LDQREEAIMEL